MSRRYKARTRGAGLAGKNLDSLGAAEIAAFPVFAPEPRAHRVVELQSMAAQFLSEAPEKRLGLLGCGGGRLGFTTQLDEFSSEPCEQSFAHGRLFAKRWMFGTGRSYISIVEGSTRSRGRPFDSNPGLGRGSRSGFRPTGVLEGVTGLHVGLHMLTSS